MYRRLRQLERQAPPARHAADRHESAEIAVENGDATPAERNYIRAHRLLSRKLDEQHNLSLVAAHEAAGTMDFLERGMVAYHRRRVGTASGRAPRPATNSRPRGSRRCSSPSRPRAGQDDDPHQDDPEPDPGADVGFRGAGPPAWLLELEEAGE